MRLLLAWPALFLPACSLLQPASPPEPAASASAVVPAVAAPGAPAPAASVVATALPVAPGDGPPQPPMALRWTLHLPPVGGHAWTRKHLEVTEDGSALWESDAGGGDGDIDEALSDRPVTLGAKPRMTRCRGRVAPTLHRKLVEAARKAMASGCTDREPGLDAASTTLAVTWQGEIKSCTLGRTGGSYALFEQARTEVLAGVCKR
jgi:hypothetical protein